jgi:hypothetical protein
MKSGHNQCYSSNIGQNTLVTGVMVDYESPASAKECHGLNGDAMADFDTLFDQLLREVLKFIY